jgi:NAD(P)-dependent dehydrogenase (short-subunit alcohol dehydrogenase family)
MQSILITGTSSGFGRLAALELARRGHRVFAGMRHVDGVRAEAAASLQREARAAGGTLEVLSLDVTSGDSVAAAVDHVVRVSGRLDVLVNTAGVAAAGISEAFTAEDAQRIFDVNFFGALRTMRAVLPTMRAQRRGLLVQVSSVLGREVVPFLALYEASKFALEGFFEASRHELAAVGVDVVLVQPGTFPTTAMPTNLAVPSDPSRSAGYPQVVPHLEAFVAGLAGYAASGHAPDPQLVADAIAVTIETPAGQRQARVVVDPNGGGGAARINEVSAAVQSGILAGLGLADPLRLAIDG